MRSDDRRAAEQMQQIRELYQLLRDSRSDRHRGLAMRVDSPRTRGGAA